MLQKTIIFVICIILVQITQATLFSPPLPPPKHDPFQQLHLKLEISISLLRLDVTKELHKLHPVIDHVKDKVDREARQTHTLVLHYQWEARARKNSIGHCLSNIKLLSQNLDLYDFKQCSKIDCDIEDTFVILKELSQSLFERKEMCDRQYRGSWKQRERCYIHHLNEVGRKQQKISRKLMIYRKRAFDVGLACVQRNYNDVKRDLCYLTCEFEDCVMRNCGPVRGGFIPRPF